MRTAARRSCLALLAAAVAGAIGPRASAQEPQRATQPPQFPQMAHQTGPTPLAGLRKRFDEFLTRTTPPSKKLDAKQRADMFEDYLAWPGNPLEVELAVRLTFPGGVGPPVGTLTVKNGTTLVAGRKETALFIQPDLRGLPPGRFAFHVHENPDCGSALKDGVEVPGLAAGGHLMLSGTGAMSGQTFTSHLGDLPNLEVDEDGVARTLVVAPRLTLSDVARRSFMIHASQDDNSARFACAVFD